MQVYMLAGAQRLQRDVFQCRGNEEQQNGNGDGMASNLGATKWFAPLHPGHPWSMGLQPEPSPDKQAQGSQLQTSPSSKPQFNILLNLNPKSKFELKVEPPPWLSESVKLWFEPHQEKLFRGAWYKEKMRC